MANTLRAENGVQVLGLHLNNIVLDQRQAAEAMKEVAA